MKSKRSLKDIGKSALGAGLIVGYGLLVYNNWDYIKENHNKITEQEDINRFNDFGRYGR